MPDTSPIPDGFEEVKPAPIPDGFEEVKPEEVRQMVQQGYEQSGQLAAQGAQAQQTHAFAQQNPTSNAALEIAKQSGVVAGLGGLGRGYRELVDKTGQKFFGSAPGVAGGQPGYFERLAQETADAPTEESKATNVIGQAAGMIPRMNPMLATGLAGGQAYGQGQALPRVAAQAALAGGTAAIFGAGATGAASTPLARIIQAASPETRLGIAQAGARAGIGAIAGGGVQAASNAISGQPVSQGVGEAAGLGSLMEIGGGALHDRGKGSPQESTTTEAPENLTPPTETPKEVASSAPPEQVTPPARTSPALPPNAASLDAGALRRFANENGIPIDRRIIDSKINQQQMSPRQAMLSYIQERTAPPRPPGEPVPQEQQPGLQQGGLGEGTRVNDQGNPVPRQDVKGGPTLVHNLEPVSGEGKTNQQLRDEAKAAGYTVPEGVGRKPLLKAIEDQRAASPRSEEPRPAPPEHIVDANRKVALEPNETVRDHAAGYMKDAGLPYAPDTTHAPLDESNAKRIAGQYDAMKHDPTDPKVAASYDALKKETLDQFRYLQKQGVKMEPWTKDGQPYKNSKEMTSDVRDNKHLYYFRGGDMPADHPLAEKLPDDPSTSYNDAFRAVHDYFGHAKEGYSFGPRGEENAWRQHSQMFSDAAKPAMTAETRGQNSWVNFGPHGEANRANPAETRYAEQKAGLLPENIERRNLKTRPESTTPEADALLRKNGIEPKPQESAPRYNRKLKPPEITPIPISPEARGIIEKAGGKIPADTIPGEGYKNDVVTERPELDREAVLKNVPKEAVPEGTFDKKFTEKLNKLLGGGDGVEVPERAEVEDTLGLTCD